MEGKLIIVSAPSGAGKTTIVNHLLHKVSGLEFSISATTRSPRGKEKDGKEYYFHFIHRISGKGLKEMNLQNGRKFIKIIFTAPLKVKLKGYGLKENM